LKEDNVRTAACGVRSPRTHVEPAGIIALVEISGAFGSNSLQVKAHRWSFSEAMLFVATEAAQTLPL